MNLREGRIGRQETAAMAWIACIIPAVFTVSTRETYENGNASYAAVMFSALLSLLLLLLVTTAMRARGCVTLNGLYRYAFGGFLAAAAAVVTAGTIILSAAVPVARMLLMLNRYVFTNASESRIALYFLITVTILTLMGLETVARTSRLFFVPVLLAFVLPVLVSAPAFESYRLYPLLGGSAASLAEQSVCGTVRFLPALLALTICGRGVQGAENVWRSGLAGAGIAALTACGVQLCLGMCYGSQTLSSMHAPLYRMTMAVRSDSAFLRLDKLLLFLWVIGTVITSAYLCYSSGLLYTKALRMRDVRPACAAFAGLAVTLGMLGEIGGEASERAAEFFFRSVWIFLAAPPVLASTVALCKRRKRAA